VTPTARRLRALAGLALAALVLAGPAATAASARSLEIRSVEITARVNPDGSMAVVERLEYDFDGDFNGGTRAIPPGDYRIVDLQVTEGGERRDLAAGFDDPNAGEVRWFGSADHEQVTGEHTYELAYTVLDAVDVFPDVGELEWQFIGSGFPQLDRVEVEVTMPGDGRDLRAFGHGDLRGVVEPVGNTVFLRVFDNPAGSLVEARIVVPATAFTVAPSGEPALEEILAEEGALAEEANAARADAARAYAAEVAAGPEPGCGDRSDRLRRECDRLDALLAEAGDRTGDEELSLEDADVYFGILDAREAIRDEIDRLDAARRARALDVAAPVVAAGGAVAWFLTWRRWGKEPARPHDIGDYWREVPEESPAVVAAIDDWGTISPAAFANTVIDLAQRGWLSITEEGDGHRFTRTQQTADEVPLRPYENRVLWRLFEGGRASVTQEELVDEAKDDRTASASWMSELKQEIRLDYDAQHYQERGRATPWLIHATVLLVVGAAAAVAVLLQAWIGAAVAGVTAVAVLGLSGLLRRRTEKGARKHAEVAGLRAFLRDFSLVDDVPVGHLALYERYLVYAVALGVADKLIEGLRMRFPELAQPDSTFATWYVAGAMHDGRSGGLDKLASLGTVGGFASEFSRATASAFSPPSSSSGGGGGFSGGGGGGGGGGSAGGW
jgi:uncharacterized membrane protein